MKINILLGYDEKSIIELMRLAVLQPPPHVGGLLALVNEPGSFHLKAKTEIESTIGMNESLLFVFISSTLTIHDQLG